VTDHASVLCDEFVAHVGTAPYDAPGDLLGVEQEFTVRLRSGWPVHFGDLLPELDSGGDALDPSHPGARRLGSGAVLSADGREAEVAVPPVPVRPGFAAETAAWGVAARRALTDVLPEPFTLSGYSTHLSISVDDARSPTIGGLYTRTFALGLMLLVDRATSPGLIVRPRPGRLELCGEFVDGPHLHAAAAYAVGSALACHGAITGRRAFASMPPQLQVQTRPAVARAGWFVDRASFGDDVLTNGRTTRVRRCDGRRVDAQQHLETAWHVAREELVGRVGIDDLAVADAVVTGARPLPCEEEVPNSDLSEPPREPQTSPLGAAGTPRVRASFWVLATASTWNVTVFRIGSRVAPRDAYAAIPRAQLGRFLELLDRGDLDDLVGCYLATEPSGRVVATTGAEPSIGDVAPSTAAITERARDAALVARLPTSDARRRKDGGGVAPSAITAGTAAGARTTTDEIAGAGVTNGDGAKRAPAIATARRGRLSSTGRWIALVVVVLIIVAIAAVALVSGGGDERAGPKPNPRACGTGVSGAQISFAMVLRSCAYTTDQLTGARVPYAYERMPFRDAKINVVTPANALVFGTPCPVHDATPAELQQAKDPITGFVGLSYIGVPVAGLSPGALVEVTLRAPDGATRTGRGVADARGYAEARVPINIPEPHLIVNARYFPNGDASGPSVPIVPDAISASGVIDAALPGFHCDRDALLARVPAPAGDASASARAVIDNSASMFPVLATLVQPGVDLDLRGPWTVDGSADGFTVSGGDVMFPFAAVNTNAERDGAGVAPVTVVHHGGTTVGPSGDGAETAWRHALPCGAGQLAFTVCPAGNRPLGSGNFAVVAAVFAKPVPLEPATEVHYSFTVGGQRYDLAFDPKSHNIAGWSLAGADPRVRAVIRNNIVLLFVPSDLAGNGSYRIQTAAGNRHDVEPPEDQPPATPRGTLPVAAVPGKPAPETVSDFVVALGHALTNGDNSFLRARLHPAVVERYGSAACDAFAAGPHTPVDFTVQSVSAPTVYTWSTDGLSRDVPGTNTVTVTSVVNGQAQPTTVHVAFVDGTWRWFTDCGDPLPGAK
jgi:hypothetical protein